MSSIDKDLKDEINVAAYFISEENNPYDVLCWYLAERLLKYESKGLSPPNDLIKQKAAQIYFEECPYDILTYRIAELEILMKYDMYDVDYIKANKC